MRPRRLDVVAIQLEPPAGSANDYLGHVDEVVRAAHRAHPADLVVLPGGLTSRLSGRFERESARPVDGQPVDLLCQLAKDLRCVLVGGFLALRGRRTVDVTVVAERTGRTTLHDASRLTWRQTRWVVPGATAGVGWVESIDDLPVGIASGLEWADRHTTAEWRASGVGLVVGGTGSCSSLGNGPFVVGSRDAWQGPGSTELGARRTALRTGVPAVLAARVGGPEATAICDGNGRVLASMAPRDGEGYVAATLDVATHQSRRSIAPTSVPGRGRAAAATGRGAAALHRLSPKSWGAGDRFAADLPDVGSADTPRPVRDTSLIEVRVESCELLATGVRRLRLAPVGERALPAWEPGAHIDVVLPGDLGRRQYSLCGEPGESSYEIAVLCSPEGRGGSVFLSEKVEVGDHLQVGRPRNHFPLLPGPHHVFVAGGIGITPILAMIRALEAGPAAGPDASWLLFYGGRSEGSMAFLDDLRELGRDRVTIFTDERTGPIDLELVRRSLTPSTGVYCCGPEALIAAVADACGDHVVHFERFARPPDDGPELDRDFTAVLAHSGTLLKVPQHTSLLDALLDAGVEVDYSCGNGVCGSCEVRVLEGEPSHRDAIYGGRPNAPEDRILACVSRARSNNLTLDL